MLEILFLIYLAGRIGKLVAPKGYPKAKYQFLLVGMWVGGELLGALVGYSLFSRTGGSFFVPYLFALLGAAFGAWLAFRITHRLPDLTAAGLSFRKPLTPAGVILACVLSMALGSLVFQALWNPLYTLAGLLDMSDRTAQVVVSALVFAVFFAFTGFILGGVFTGWMRPGSWVGWFFLAGLAAGMFNGTLPTLLCKSMFVYPLVWGIDGVIFALCFAFLLRREPEYEDNTPLIPMLLFGFIGFFLLDLAYNWIFPTFIAKTRWAYQVSFGFNLLIGASEGLIIGLGLEIPRLLKPAVAQPGHQPLE
jgi:hypothetical protein